MTAGSTRHTEFGRGGADGGAEVMTRKMATWPAILRARRLKALGAGAIGAWEYATCGAAYNPLSRGVIQNPYPAYAVLRRRSPVHRSRILGSWLLTRYGDVVDAAKRHETFSNDPRHRRLTRSVLPPAPDSYSILLVDPPQHSRLRRVAAQAFTKARLEELSRTISESAETLIDAALRRGRVEWISEVAEPLAMDVMMELLDLPSHHRERWRLWSRNRAGLLEMIATRAQRKSAHLAGSEMQRYFLSLLARRRDSNADDAISIIARASTRDEISLDEAADMLSVLMVAGNETTTNLVGNGMLALLDNPDQLDALRADPSRTRSAVNEMLRYDSPVQTDFRIARQDITVRGRTIRAGDGVILLTGAANRDEEAYPDGERFDIERKGPRHTSFGHGVHHCIGAELARMEAVTIFTEALARLTRIKQAPPFGRYRTSTVVRGLTKLHLDVT